MYDFVFSVQSKNIHYLLNYFFNEEKEVIAKGNFRKHRNLYCIVCLFTARYAQTHTEYNIYCRQSKQNKFFSRIPCCLCNLFNSYLCNGG